MKPNGWARIPLQLLLSSHLLVFSPFLFFSSVFLGFGLTFLLVIPGSIIFLAVHIQLEKIFFLLCFFQVVCTVFFFFSLLRLRQKLRQRTVLTENEEG